MKLSLIRKVLTPNRGTKLSAGIDFYVPEFNENFCEDLLSKNNLLQSKEGLMYNKLIKLKSGDRILIPSGVKVNFNGTPKALIAFNKSGISSKKGLDVLACVIDQDYQGEIHISLVNTSNEEVIISENEKIVQLITVPIFYEEVEVVEEQELYNSLTERGDGGFGSTNK